MAAQRTDFSELAPIAYTPAGDPVVWCRDLPEFGVPGCFCVRKDGFEINGWWFPYETINRPLMEWLQERFIAWRRQDESEENLDWLEAILKCLQDSVTESFGTRR